MASRPPTTAAEITARKEAKVRADAKVEARRRRAEAGWYEWMLGEFARYVYGLCVVAVLVFAPLQMGDAWIPFGRPPVVGVGIVVALAVAFDVAAGYLAFLGYRFLWHEAGPIARLIERHEAERRDETRETL